MRMAPTHRFGGQEVAQFERIRWCGLIGRNVSPGVGLGGSKAQAKHRISLSAYGSGCSLQLQLHLPECHHVSHHDDNKLNL